MNISEKNKTKDIQIITFMASNRSNLKKNKKNLFFFCNKIIYRMFLKSAFSLFKGEERF